MCMCEIVDMHATMYMSGGVRVPVFTVFLQTLFVFLLVPLATLSCSLLLPTLSSLISTRSYT